MPFIGKQPQTGAYSKLDAITTSATATYNLTLDGGAYYPQSANHLLVSLNGVMQAPQDSFTVSGSQITFASALTSSDNIDFIMALGDTLDIGVPSAGSVNTSQLADGAVTSAKLAGLTDSDMPTGSVLQVVQGTTNTDVSITGSTYTDSGLSASITPSSTSSKILVLVNQSTYLYGSSSAVHGGVRLLRDSTTILNPFTDFTGPLEPYIETIGASQMYHSWRFNINYLDNPSTTSSVTYKTQGALRSPGSSRTLRFQTAAGSITGTSTIVLMEIAG